MAGDHLAALIGRVRDGYAAARDDDLLLHAAALAFYGLVSVAPLVVIALWLTSLLVGPEQLHQVANSLARAAPPALGADRALERVADVGASLGLVAVVAALWPATAYGSALVRALDRASGEHAVGGLRGRGAALVLVGLLPVFVLGSLVASYAGGAVLGGGTAVDEVISLVLATVAGFIATVATVLVVYRVFPRTPPGWRPTLDAALIAAGGISLLSVAYVAYLRFGANFEDRYASDALAAVVLLGFWLYAANATLLLGYRSAQRRSAGPARPR